MDDEKLFSFFTIGLTITNLASIQKILHSIKVHIFWKGHKILRNLHQLFVLCTASQIIGGDFAKLCGLLRIYELYQRKKRLVATLLNKKGPAIKLTIAEQLRMPRPLWSVAVMKFRTNCVKYTVRTVNDVLSRSTPF